MTRAERRGAISRMGRCRCVIPPVWPHTPVTAMTVERRAAPSLALRPQRHVLRLSDGVCRRASRARLKRADAALGRNDIFVNIISFIYVKYGRSW